MSYFHCETPAWVDPYLLKRASDEHLLDDDDEEQRVIKKKLTEMAKRRDACSIPRDPKTDKTSVVTPQYVAHPIEFRANTAGDRNAPQHFTLVAVSNNTFVGVTKNNMIHFFDQTNDIPITSISMLGQTPMDERTLTLQQKLANAATAGAAGVLNSMNIPGVTPTATSTNFVDAKDVATKLFLDSMGRYAVVVFQSGVNLLYHIKRSDAHEDDTEETEKEKKKKKKEKKKKGKKDNDAKDKPQRFDIALTPEVTGGASSFSIESIGWDEHNSYESGSGEVILASQKHGILVACRFESSGVAGARHLFTFPAPLNKQPIHSVAMTREQEGQKRACILVSMDHKLFFFRSHNSTLETAFILADLTVPDNDAEAAYLAAAGSASGGTLPLKNFWALPVQSPVISSAASQSSKHSSPAELVHPPVSKVTIHSPHRSYTDEQLPLTFTWTYHDTVVQGVLMPFPANVTGTAGARGQTGIQESSTLARSSAAAAISNRRKDHLRNAQSGAGDSSVDCLQVMMDSMRIVHVENCSMLVAAAEYALQFDAESAAPPFNAPPPTVGAVPTPVTPLVRSGSFASPQHSRGAALTSPTSATNMVYALQHERVVRVHATYFYLTIVTQTKLYIFASVPCVPLPSSTSPWEVRNRLIYTHSLSSTQAPPPTVVLQREGTVRDYSNAPKLPPLLYKADSCLEVIRDVKYTNKIYLCVAKEIIELPLPSMKRTFAVLLMQYAVATGKKNTTPPPTALTITQRHFPYSTGSSSSGPAAAEKKDQGCHLDGNTISKLATTNSVFCMLPWTPVTGVSDEAVVQGGAPGTRSRSGTVLRPQLQRSTGTGGGSAMKLPLQKQSGARQLELPTYTTSGAMKLYGASRFPIRPGTRSHALPTDVLFHVALSLSAKQPKLRKMVQNTFGELLFSQERYLEAAAWLGRYSTQGADEWFTRFTFLCNTPSHGVLPLLLFCLVRTRIITDSGNSMFGPGAVAVSCLSAAALVLLLDRCNAVRDAELLLASSFTTTSTSTSTKPLSSLSTAIQSHHRLTNPAELLAELLKTQKDLLPWSVVQESLFRVGSEDQVFTVCRTMDKLQDLLQYLLNHGRYFDALQLVIERSKHEADEYLCYDEEGYVHPGIGAHLWQSYGGVFMKHFPVRMIKLGWVPHGASIGVDPLRLLPMLSRYDPAHNETQFEATASADDVRRVIKEQERRRQLLHRPTTPEDTTTAALEDCSVAASTKVVEGILESDTKRSVEHIGITYLRHLIREGYTEQAISNLLLNFLAISGSDDELKEFVLHDKSLDLQYALRVCHRHNRPVAVMYITFALGHLQEAIRMALDHGEVARAKSLVERVQDGTAGTRDQGAAAARQELWKMIVQYVATQQFGPKNALLLISESKNDVNVSHVIPHLSDDVMLSEFKTELLENVSDFGRLMKEVREGIEDSKADVELLRGDVTDAMRTIVKVNTAKRCDHCGTSIWSTGRGDAVMFRGCAHSYHQGCLRERWSTVDLSKVAPRVLALQGDGGADEDNRASHMESCFLCSPIALRHLLTEPIGGTATTTSLSTIGK